ncbi:o-succinylbenzoate--CoA ligase [Oligoflexia bacterium]|nr:o-succinylbenzoate--CoA ligase [Oligoflexia bacterium]
MSLDLFQQEKRFGSEVAIRADGVRLSYSEVAASVGLLIHEFKAQGIEAGDRVAFIAQNSVQYVLALLALLKLEASFVPLNVRLDQAMLARQLKTARCKLLLCDDKAEVWQPFCTKVVNLKQFVDRVLVDANLEAPLSEADLELDISYGTECGVVFTSGSSGDPKGVVFTKENILQSALSVSKHCNYRAAHCWLLSLPLYHVGGLSILMRAITSGGSVYVINKLSSLEVFTAVQSGQVTHLSLVPTVLEELIANSDNVGPLKEVQYILLGGAPVSVALVKQIQQHNLPVATSYGMTELASTAVVSDLGCKGCLEGSTGKLLAHVKLKIIDDAGQTCRPNEHGQIVVGGASLFKGYLSENRDELQEVGSWFKTGDIGYLREGGTLVVAGRSDRMIISGGENIHPQELEHVASDFPGLKHVAVIAVDHAKWGQRPILFVEPHSIDSFSSDDLSLHLAEYLPKFKRPDRIIVLSKLPLTGIGKVDYAAVRKVL